MAKERTFYGTIQLINGVKRFAPKFPKIWQHVLNQLKEGQICVIYFKIVKRVRSLSSNNLYWLYLSIIEQESGEDEDTLHEIFKKEFLPWEVKKKFGITYEKLTSTTELSTDEFSVYMRRIEALTGILIPDTEGWKNERDSAPTL
jgi:hypothetical protein